MMSGKFSLRELIEQYQHATNSHFEEINHDQVHATLA
jgi:hypothetical protein